MEHSNLGVRRLLRKLRHPGQLERDHYAALLRKSSQAGSAREVVLGTLQGALRPYPEVYWTIVRRIDVNGESAKSVARDLFISYRTLHRYRSAAIAAVADALDCEVGLAPASLEDRLREIMAQREHAPYAKHIATFFADPRVRQLIAGR